MITAGSIATLGAYWFVGATLYRALVLRLCGLDVAPPRSSPTVRELLLRSMRQ
jgi:hypothetical protein